MFPGKPRLPDQVKQAGRLEMQFPVLQQVMEKQRLALQDNPLGLQPELALVLETIGSIENFINAVRRIKGLEWLGEFELDDIAPQYGFEDEHDPQKLLKGQLFLVMTNQRAFQELQSLFNRWQQDPDTKFPYGLAPWKHAFAHLYAIRPWDAQDRIRETGILEDWQFRVEHEQEMVPFETELWFRGDQARRQQAESHLRSIIEALGGEVIQQCAISEIAYHGILGRIPLDQVSQVLAQDDVRLLQCEDIMHLRPVGQCAIHIPEDLTDTVSLAEDRQSELPEGAPIVALFDGLPLTGHRLLNGRLIVDDPDGFEDNYQARERVHGTAMASLICHGDLDGGGEPSLRPVYVRPIMQPRPGFDGRFLEAIPEGILPIDLVHRAVRRLYEYEGTEPPVAPSVRVINLSVCDRSRPFDLGMSSWARLLDWLSWKYNVLFVVSAGNHLHDIELSAPRADFSNLDAEDREKAVVEAIAADTRHRRLLAPAETLNGLTVASTHADASSPALSSTLIDPYAHTGLPSTISAHGPGYRRAIKPDIYLPGGRQFLIEKLGNTHPHAILQVAPFNRPPGQRVATPGAPGELNRTWHTRGTSNAAALASRWAMSLFDTIERLRVQSEASLPTDYDVVLLKTLLVHGADWAEAGALYESILRNTQNSRIFTDYVGRFLGYGSADVAKVLACTDQRVTVLGAGQLTNDESQEYRFPLPPSLSAVTNRRRLAITLAWLTPVNSTNQKYRIAQLWFDPKNNLAPNRKCADFRAAQRGTVQHEVLVGDQAVDFQDGDAIVIKVNCRADAGDIPGPIQYGLAVTLEVAEGVDIPVYQEVRDRLRVRVPVRGTSPT
ncbi:MAG: S8 family peptidase [Chloroflexi bacterium]|nr:S8 family peptidase [Chloroflexota bacterium]